MAPLRKNKKPFQQEVLRFRAENPTLGKGYRVQKADKAQFISKKGKKRGQNRQDIRKPMTSLQFLDWYASVEGGSHTRQQGLDE